MVVGSPRVIGCLWRHSALRNASACQGKTVAGAGGLFRNCLYRVWFELAADYGSAYQELGRDRGPHG